MAREVKKKTYKTAKSARTTSISNTQWKKNVAGEKGEAGRLYGPKGNLYTGTVKMGDGKTAVYKKGKKVVKAKPQTRSSRSGTGSGSGTTPPPPSGRTRFSSSAANRGGYSAKGYQRRMTKIAGSGTDAVNAASSKGSAHTSMAKSRKAAAKRTALGQQRRTLAKKIGIDVALSLNPVTRPIAGAKMSYQAGKKLGGSSSAQNFFKSVKKTAQKPSRFFQGY